MADEKTLQQPRPDRVGHRHAGAVLRLTHRSLLAYLIPHAMSENHSLLRVRKTDYICDHCSEGCMMYSGSSMVTATAVRIYYHRCEICGVQVAFPAAYPKIEYIQE
ncbi:hypothetical protein EBX31_11180, partial [bacterium]|nr:hypothetical protein [bacterium]